MPRTRESQPVSSRDVYVPNESFSCSIGGIDRTFVKDQTTVREGHPVLAKYAHLFHPIRVHYDVEAATAPPGEVRG